MDKKKAIALLAVYETLGGGYIRYFELLKFWTMLDGEDYFRSISRPMVILTLGGKIFDNRMIKKLFG